MTQVNGRLSCLHDDWHTPNWIIETARKVMGTIDLDPASNLKANQKIQAQNFYTVNNSGLDHSWHGNVFLNPPGGKTKGVSNAQIWWDKAESEFLKGNINNLFYVGFSIEQLNLNPTMFRYLVCTLRHRIKFVKGEMNKPSHGNMLVFMSRSIPNLLAFERNFKSKGLVFSAISTKDYINNLIN